MKKAIQIIVFISSMINNKTSRKISVLKKKILKYFLKDLFLLSSLHTYSYKLLSNMRSGSSPILGPTILICALFCKFFFQVRAIVNILKFLFYPDRKPTEQ